VISRVIETDSPWENGCIESLNGKLRDELLNAGVFYSLREAQVVIEQWRRHYNTIHPQSSLGYRLPALEVIMRRVSQPIALRPP
jgi:putative transposase